MTEASWIALLGIGGMIIIAILQNWWADRRRRDDHALEERRRSEDHSSEAHRREDDQEREESKARVAARINERERLLRDVDAYIETVISFEATIIAHRGSGQVRFSNERSTEVAASFARSSTSLKALEDGPGKLAAGTDQIHDKLSDLLDAREDGREIVDPKDQLNAAIGVFKKDLMEFRSVL